MVIIVLLCWINESLTCKLAFLIRTLEIEEDYGCSCAVLPFV